MDAFLRIIEILAGFYYFVFGVDGFFKKIPLPVPSENAQQFLAAIEKTKYILFTVKLVEIIVGIMWVLGYKSGLAWLLFTPIWFNILGYHFLINKKEKALPLGILLIHLILALKNREFIWQLFQ